MMTWLSCHDIKRPTNRSFVDVSTQTRAPDCMYTCFCDGLSAPASKWNGIDLFVSRSKDRAVIVDGIIVCGMLEPKFISLLSASGENMALYCAMLL